MKRILLSFLILVLTCLCVSCDSLDQEENYSYTISYLNADMSGLVDREYESPHSSDETKVMAGELLKQLQSSGDDAKAKSPISENVDILDFQIQNRQLAIFFSAAYYERSGVEEILSRAAIVETLCQLEAIDYVEFYVEDQPLMISGNAVGLMSRDRFVLNLDSEGKEQSRQITLYFSNKKGDRLRAVSTTVTYNSATPLAELLVNQLIQGEETIQGMKNNSSEVRPAIPEDTILNNLTIRDQVCYVDLGSGFNNLLSGISSEVTVYSIFNTLCELANVNRVQFTVDGEPQDKYGEMDSFSSVLERKLDLVEQTEQ